MVHFEFRSSNCMDLLALQNKFVKEQKLDDDPNSVKATVLVEPCTGSLLATEIGMRMSRMGESRRRTKRMSLDMASSYRSPYDAAPENYLDGTPTVRKLSSVSQHFLFDTPPAVVDALLRSKSFSGSKAHHSLLRQSKSTWGGEEEEDTGIAGLHSPLHYDMLQIQFSQNLLCEATVANNFRYSKCDSLQHEHNLQPVTLHEDDIFPGNTRHLSRLRVKKIASEFENHAPAKLGNLADRQQPQERSKLQKLGRSFSRHDTRSMKKLPRAPSSLPTSPLGNNNSNSQETHATQIFHKLLRRSSRVNSEVSTRRETRSSWEPERERVVYKKHVSNAVVVGEKCSLPKRLGPIQGLQKTQQASTDASKSGKQNSWWPFKWKWKSKELRPQGSMNKSLVVLGDGNKVDITTIHHQDVYHYASSDKLDSSPLSPNKLARSTSAFNMIKERASSRHEESFKSWVWGTSPFAPDQPCNPTRDAEKYLLPPRRLHK
jgi:hypothetical protein